MSNDGKSTRKKRKHKTTAVGEPRILEDHVANDFSFPEHLLDMPMQIKQNYARMSDLAAKETGDQHAYDPLMFLGRFMNDQSQPPELRIVCATKLLPYSAGPAPQVRALLTPGTSPGGELDEPMDPHMAERRKKAYDFVLDLVGKAADDGSRHEGEGLAQDENIDDEIEDATEIPDTPKH